MKPDAENEFNPDPVYMSDLVNSTGLTRGELAKLLGVSDRSICQAIGSFRTWLNSAWSAWFCRLIECVLK